MFPPKFCVVAPYESHDGEVGYTVQEVDNGGELSGIIAEFADKLDAAKFAALKELIGSKFNRLALISLAEQKGREIRDYRG